MGQIIPVVKTRLAIALSKNRIFVVFHLQSKTKWLLSLRQKETIAIWEERDVHESWVTNIKYTATV